jgi:hypothetical protein
MGKWLDFARQLEAADEGEDNKDDRDNSPPNVPNVPNVLGDIPPSARLGLARLQAMAAPRITRPDIWLAVVADAVRLASDGWAVHAIGLGWSLLDLWGCSPEPGGNADQDGLAVWIDGRRVLLLDGDSCIVENGPNARTVFNRRSVAAGGVLLWDIGGVRP